MTRKGRIDADKNLRKSVVSALICVRYAENRTRMTRKGRIDADKNLRNSVVSALICVPYSENRTRMTRKGRIDADKNLRKSVVSALICVRYSQKSPRHFTHFDAWNSVYEPAGIESAGDFFTPRRTLQCMRNCAKIECSNRFRFPWRLLKGRYSFSDNHL